MIIIIIIKITIITGKDTTYFSHLIDTRENISLLAPNFETNCRIVVNHEQINVYDILITFQEKNLNLNRDSNSDLQVQIFLLKCDKVNLQRHKL